MNVDLITAYIREQRLKQTVEVRALRALLRLKKPEAPNKESWRTWYTIRTCSVCRIPLKKRNVSGMCWRCLHGAPHPNGHHRETLPTVLEGVSLR